MSRSYKKHGLVKIGDPDYKKIYNRKIRRKPLDYPSGKTYRRDPDCCSWEICDLVCGYFADEIIPEDEKKDAYRYFIK